MRILLVEEEDDGGEILRRGLVSQHHSLDLARDGEEELEYALCNDYDLLILDVMLPKMDGRTLCKKLRQEKVMTPILMLTALGSSKDVINGLDVGGDDYLVKPFNFGILMARVRSLTRRSVARRRLPPRHAMNPEHVSRPGPNPGRRCLSEVSSHRQSDHYRTPFQSPDNREVPAFHRRGNIEEIRRSVQTARKYVG